ncbi:hypothetical protein Tco_0175607 [Tanacetum coccineum]
MRFCICKIHCITANVIFSYLVLIWYSSDSVYRKSRVALSWDKENKLAAIFNDAVDESSMPTKRRELACTAFDYAICVNFGASDIAYTADSMV